MKFFICLAALLAVAVAEPGVALGYGGLGYGGLGYGGLGYAGYGGYGHGLGYAAPVVKTIAPVATSYSSVNQVHHAPAIIARPAVYAAHAAPVWGQGLGYAGAGYGYGHGLGYGLGYGHGLGYAGGYKTLIH